MRIINQTKNIVLAESAIIADSPLKRMKGLLGRKEFNVGGAMVLSPCNSIHTFFMRFPIDVVFADKKYQIVEIKLCVKPFRASGIYWRASFAIEFPAGTLSAEIVSLGDQLFFIDKNSN